ncbi:predicted protein [Histoplasma mississippiense (nom. inval.)]|uniref:predicted protein n=1 Tax=Ajellomyces capsulatus (strain NAm1 / WU24) TaxID=2059318 RepID=UPI000157B517|nr:predicted protein [Histoplasma mississippiense (nom. inval.)]EDN03070.1 predicted protein [Histoplasma mississippiense (nom. inval.)]
MPIRQREKSIEEFSKDPEIRILVCSLRTAGTGLDLTAANKCIFVDLWWNEAIEQQAFFRLFRINQKRKVEFVRVVVRNSIDDRLQLLQEDKSNNIDGVLGSEVLSSRDSLTGLCTVLGVEQDDSTETGYRFISDEEAERSKDPGHAEADKCESSASNTGSRDSHITPLGALGIEEGAVPVIAEVEGSAQAAHERVFYLPKCFEGAISAETTMVLAFPTF